MSTTKTPEHPTIADATRGALDIKQAATYLGVKEQTLRTWRHYGTGPKSYVLGARIWYDLDDLAAYVAVEKVKSARGGLA